MRQIQRHREKLLKELAEAKKQLNYLKIIEITKKIRRLDDEQIQIERVSYVQLAEKSMNKREVSLFTADLIAMTIACDILQNYAMKVEAHMRRFEDFESSDILKVKHAIRILADMVKVIDIISADHPIKDENGNQYTLSDHYASMVDEVETSFFGLENIISKVVSKTITIDKDDIQ